MIITLGNTAQYFSGNRSRETGPTLRSVVLEATVMLHQSASVCISSGQAEFGESDQTSRTLRSKASMWREIIFRFYFPPAPTPR
jgi:hypothetical protein